MMEPAMPATVQKPISIGNPSFMKPSGLRRMPLILKTTSKSAKYAQNLIQKPANLGFSPVLSFVMYTSCSSLIREPPPILYINTWHLVHLIVLIVPVIHGYLHQF